MMLSTKFSKRAVRSKSARYLKTQCSRHGSRRPPLLSLALAILGWVLGDLVDVDIELQELLSDKVFDEAIIIDELLVINLGSALELDLLLVHTC